MSRKTSRKMFRDKSRNKSRINRLRPLAGLLAAGLSLPGLAAAQSKPYPTYVTGPQPNGSWVVGDGQVITPAGTQVDLGIRVRAKAIALNPNRHNHTAAVLTLGASEAVEVFDTNTGVVLQNYIALGQDSSGSYSGIAYSADGKYLVFSQDSSNVTIAKVTDEGLLEDDAQVSVPPNNSFITCFPNSPMGAYARPCGTFYTPSTSYPGGVAFSKDGKSAYALLNQNDTLTKIDLTAKPPKQGAADPRRQRAAQHRDQQRRHDRLRQQRGWPGRYARRTSRSTPPALKSSPTRWLAPRSPVPFLWLI